MFGAPAPGPIQAYAPAPGPEGPRPNTSTNVKLHLRGVSPSDFGKKKEQFDQIIAKVGVPLFSSLSRAPPGPMVRVAWRCQRLVLLPACSSTKRLLPCMAVPRHVP